MKISQIGRYESGVFDQGAAEILAYDAKTRRLFVVNAEAASVDILDISKPEVPELVGRIEAGTYGGKANSVAVDEGLVAVAIEGRDPQAEGMVVFFDSIQLKEQRRFIVGAMPDMVTFSPDGRYVLIANEGEPNASYDKDPEGSISIIDISKGLAEASVKTAGFSDYNEREAILKRSGVRIFGPNATVAQDLEPEYVAVSQDSKTAWVSLQENNALAAVEIETARVIAIMPLGYKDHGEQRNALDPSDKDGIANIKPWPVLGMYQPDTIATYQVSGETYIVSANEGDARDYDGFSEEARIADLKLDRGTFEYPQNLQSRKYLGRLKVTTTQGDLDRNGDYERLFSFGARSFSIWDITGNQVYDSGSDFEKITAIRLGGNFNNDSAKHDPDGRSDDKGPEPEALTIAEFNDRYYAFIGLERAGGIMIYDISNPRSPVFVDYVINRDFGKRPEAAEEWSRAGDLGPESLVIIQVEDSPIDTPLLAVGNEVSGTTTLYRIDFD